MSTLPQSTKKALENGAAGFETSESGTFVASGADSVNLYRLLVIRNALGFEIKTGMKMTRASALKAANAALGTTYKRKQQALDHLNLLLP
jgi:hypothetical protein